MTEKTFKQLRKDLVNTRGVALSYLLRLAAKHKKELAQARDDLAHAEIRAHKFDAALTDACTTQDVLRRNRDFWFETCLSAEKGYAQTRQEAQVQCDLARTAESALADERRLRQEAELAAHIHDKACRELAQVSNELAHEKIKAHKFEAALQAERQLRREAERRDDVSRLVIDGAHEALDECQIERNYDDGKPASARTRVFWLNQRAERATLAQLVTPELAALLERLAWLANNYETEADGDAARELARRIREALALEGDDESK